MILDNGGILAMVQSSADMSGKEQNIYRRSNGSYLYCAKGNEALLRPALQPNENLQFVQSVKPSNWPKEETSE